MYLEHHKRKRRCGHLIVEQDKCPKNPKPVSRCDCDRLQHSSKQALQKTNRRSYEVGVGEQQRSRATRRINSGLAKGVEHPPV